MKIYLVVKQAGGLKRYLKLPCLSKRFERSPLDNQLGFAEFVLWTLASGECVEVLSGDKTGLTASVHRYVDTDALSALVVCSSLVAALEIVQQNEQCLRRHHGGLGIKTG